MKKYFLTTLLISVLMGIILPLVLRVKDTVYIAIFFDSVWFIYAVVHMIIYFLVIGRRNLRRSKEMVNEKWGYS